LQLESVHPIFGPTYHQIDKTKAFSFLFNQLNQYWLLGGEGTYAGPRLFAFVHIGRWIAPFSDTGRDKIGARRRQTIVSGDVGKSG
jgi:hypothetical protein